MELILGIIALSTIGWLANNWIRAKHGYDLEDEWGGKTRRLDKADEFARLVEDNTALRASLERLEKRTATLEAIVTDRGFAVASQIEALRDQPGPDVAGTPLRSQPAVGEPV